MKYYICSPLSADTPKGIEINQAKARGWVERVETITGCKAIAPHVYLPEMLDDNNEKEREIALEFGIKILSICDCLVICGDLVSAGMAKEIAYARQNGIRVINFSDVFKEEGARDE